MRVKEERLRIIAEIAKRINRGQALDKIMETLFDDLREILPCHRIAIGLLESDGHTLVTGPVQSDGRIYLRQGYRESIDGSSLQALIESGETRIINDLESRVERRPESKASRLILREGLRSSLTVPLVVADKRLGVMWFSSRERNAYSAEHESFLKVIAGHLAILLEREQMVGQLERDLKELADANQLQNENAQLREVLEQARRLPDLIGTSPTWKKVLKQMDMVARTDSIVLIHGETGTGKELVARTIHQLSARRRKPFVAVNCAALSSELISSELFGHEKGAFTGAAQQKLGRIEIAQGGTLLLDEVAELPFDIQGKLLRVLQEREFERVGGTKAISADVRILAATNRDLSLERRAGRFRDDLFFRLNVFPLHTPPLRDRREDLEPLLLYFVRRYAQKVGKSFDRIDPKTLERCMDYPWPGNIRELENLVERSVILCPEPTFDMSSLVDIDALEGGVPASSMLADTVRAHIRRILKMTRGRIYGPGGAADRLGLKPTTLQMKMKKLGLNRKDFLSS